MRKLSFEEMENVKGGDGIGLVQAYCGAVLYSAMNSTGAQKNEAIEIWGNIASTCAVVGVI